MRFLSFLGRVTLQLTELRSDPSAAFRTYLQFLLYHRNHIFRWTSYAYAQLHIFSEKENVYNISLEYENTDIRILKKGVINMEN